MMGCSGILGVDRQAGSSLSIALATYNGGRYLADQLHSISVQSRLPDEVVVCDDGSTDRTLELLNEWALRSTFMVHIHRNDRTLGSTKNFDRAISLCTGDIIALADQDDVWKPAKLAKLEEALVTNQRAGLVFSDADVVDDQLRPLGYRMWRSRRFRQAEQRLVREGSAIKVQLRRNVVTGATMAFRASYRDLVLPIPVNPVHVHDGWVATLISSVAEITFVEEPLILYRQHAANQIGAHPPTGARMLARAAMNNSLSEVRDSNRATADWFEQLEERLISMASVYRGDPLVAAEIRAKIQHCRERASLPKGPVRRLAFVLRGLMYQRYHRYSIGIWAAAKDLTA